MVFTILACHTHATYVIPSVAGDLMSKAMPCINHLLAGNFATKIACCRGYEWGQEILRYALDDSGGLWVTAAGSG
jgi:hypothetical protein